MSGEVFETNEGWRLLLGSSAAVASRSARLETALQRLVDADYLLARTAAIRSPLALDIPTHRHEGRFEPVDLLRPLLMRLSIEDELYAYQRHGAAWLLRHDRAILADDMGLGKTAQAIAALRRLFRHGRADWGLVVAPRTLLANWVAEFAHWAPELVVEVLVPDPNERAKTWRSARNRSHVAVTSYDHVRIAGESIARTVPSFTVADEAHRLRNQESLTSQEFRQLNSPTMWFLTGTPVENRAADLAVLMSLLEPDRFSPDDAEQHASSLRSRVRPYILRRRKSDVLSELPPVIERNEIIELTDAQRDSYNRTIGARAGRPDSDYLALFTALRSICDVDPATGASSKIERTQEIISDAEFDESKVVVFSYLIAPLEELACRLADSGLGSQLLVGSMSLAERNAAVRRFKEDKSCVALLASMRVASEGLTLTEASTVVFVNRWWNPSANAQARDRVVRIGQTQPVQIVTFTCRRTVEERLPAILDRKQVTFESLVEALADGPEDLFDPA